jgi:hypothetical protein
VELSWGWRWVATPAEALVKSASDGAAALLRCWVAFDDVQLELEVSFFCAF